MPSTEITHQPPPSAKAGQIFSKTLTVKHEPVNTDPTITYFAMVALLRLNKTHGTAAVGGKRTVTADKNDPCMFAFTDLAIKDPGVWRIEVTVYMMTDGADFVGQVVTNEVTVTM